MPEQAVVEVYRQGPMVCIGIVVIPDSPDDDDATDLTPAGVAFGRLDALGLALLIVKHTFRWVRA